MAKTSTPGTHKVKKGFLAVFMNLILWIFSLSCIFPIVWMIYSSLKEKRAFNADIIGLPKSPTLINYTRILSNPGLPSGTVDVEQPSYHGAFHYPDHRVQLHRWLYSGARSLQTEPCTVYYVPDGYADPDSFPSGSDLRCI